MIAFIFVLSNKKNQSPARIETNIYNIQALFFTFYEINGEKYKGKYENITANKP